MRTWLSLAVVALAAVPLLSLGGIEGTIADASPPALGTDPRPELRHRRHAAPAGAPSASEDIMFALSVLAVPVIASTLLVSGSQTLRPGGPIAGPGRGQELPRPCSPGRPGSAA